MKLEYKEVKPKGNFRKAYTTTAISSQSEVKEGKDIDPHRANPT